MDIDSTPQPLVSQSVPAWRIRKDNVSSCSSTESMSEEELSIDEELLRKEIKNWLSLHGAKLFNLEASKYLAKREGTGQRPVLKPVRTKSGECSKKKNGNR